MRVLWIFALSLFVTGAIAQKMDRPAYNIGDTWIYEVSGGDTPGRNVHRVTGRTEDGGYEMTVTSPSGESTATYDADTNLLQFRGRPYKPAKAVWQFPLEVGKTYEGPTFETPHTRRAGVTVTARASVRSITAEKITTPAGTFDAIKVHVSFAYQLDQWNRYSNSFEETYWLVPAVGRYVKYEFLDYGNRTTRSEELLIEYKRVP